MCFSILAINTNQPYPFSVKKGPSNLRVKCQLGASDRKTSVPQRVNSNCCKKFVAWLFRLRGFLCVSAIEIVLYNDLYGVSLATVLQAEAGLFNI
jgi:hypothetical protein